jgi:hypothetical protein
MRGSDREKSSESKALRSLERLDKLARLLLLYGFHKIGLS